MQDVLENVDPDRFASGVQNLRQQIANGLSSPEAVNPRVRALYEQMDRDITSAGDNFTPAHLQQMRANFNEKASPVNPSAYGSAPRHSPAVNDAISSIDNVLNDSSGGRWQNRPG